MRITRKLTLGLTALLLLGAFTAASASASQSSFAAGSYPASIAGEPEGQMIFSTASSAGFCEAGLHGQMSATSPMLTLGVTGSCKQGIFGGSINSNGCKVTFNSDFKTLNIGPAGCGPISVNLGTCTTYILPQNGIPVSYEATTSGGFPAVRASVSTNKLKYRECDSSGAIKENGYLSGTWILGARNPAGIPTSLSLTTPSYVNLLAAEKYPAALANSTEGTDEAKFTLEGGAVRCAPTYAGTLTSVSEYANLVPSFSKCVVFGIANGIVNGNGCTFAASALTGNQIISCPAGKAVTISFPANLGGCEATIGSQENLAGASTENTTGTNGRPAVRLKYNMSGLSYTVTNDSYWLCPFKGVGAKTGGAFTNSVLVEGSDSAGPIGIKVGA